MLFDILIDQLTYIGHSLLFINKNAVVANPIVVFKLEEVNFLIITKKK